MVKKIPQVDQYEENSLLLETKMTVARNLKGRVYESRFEFVSISNIETSNEVLKFQMKNSIQYSNIQPIIGT